MARKLEVLITGDAGSLERAFGRASSSAGSFGRTVGRAGRTVAAATAVAGAGVAALGGFAVKSAVDFESSFAGVRKTVAATESQFKELEKGFIGLSKVIPVNVNALNEIGEAAGQLGIKRRAILSFTETIAKLGVTTNLAGEEGAQMLARFANITQMPQGQFDRLGATIVALGNAGASTEQEIAGMSLRLAGASKQVGITQPQILGLANALSSVGIEAESGGTALSTAMVKIDKAVATGGKAVEGFAQVSGLSAAAFVEQWDKKPAEALVTFIEGLARVKREGGNVFEVLDKLGLGSIRVRDALLRTANAGDLLRKSMKLGEEAWRENIALNVEAEKRFKTTASQLQLLKNNVQAYAIVLGSQLLPIINEAILALGGFVREFSAAKGFRAKLNVVWEGIQEAGGKVTETLRRAFKAVDWNEVWAGAEGIAEGMAQRLRKIDWTRVGESVIDGLVAALAKAGDLAKSLASTVMAAVRQIDWVDVGKVIGPGLAAAIAVAFATLLDPMFWIRNWELALAVASVAFGGPIGRLGAKLVAPLVRLGGSIVLGIVGGIERFAPRMASVLLRALVALPGIAGAVLGQLTAVVGRQFARLGTLARFTVKVLGISAAISAITDFVSGLHNRFVALQEQAQQWAVDIGRAIIGGIVSGLGAALDVGSLVGEKLQAIPNTLAAVAAQVPGAAAAIGQSIVDGIISGLSALPALAGQALSPLIGIVSSSFAQLSGATRQAWSAIQGVIEGVISWFRSSVVPPVAAVVAALVALWRRFGDEVMAVVRSAFTIISTIIETAMRNIRAVIEAVMAVIRGDWGKAWEALKSIATNTLNGLRTIITGGLARIVPAAAALALSIGTAIVRGIAQGLSTLVSTGLAQLQKLPGILSGVAGQAVGWAYAIGRGIVTGIVSGLSGLIGEVAGKISGGVKSAIDSAKGALGIGSPSKLTRDELGKPLGEGVVIGMGAGLVSLSEEMKKKIAAAITSAKEAVASARGEFSSAFSSLASEALSAFDSAMSQWKAPAQIRLDKFNLKEQIADLKADIRSGAAELKTAQKELNAALVGGDPEAIASAQAERLSAQQRYNDALIAQRDFNLQRLAQKQTEAHEKEAARDRVHLQKQLDNLQAFLAKHPEKYEEVQGKIRTLLAKHGVENEFFGTAAGIAFANGLSKATNAVVNAMHAILKRIEKLAKLHSNAEEGPLSDLDKWWAPFGKTLAAGISDSEVLSGVRGLATSAKSAWEEGVKGFGGGLGGSLVGVGLTLPPPDIAPTTDALLEVDAAVAASRGVVDVFRETITALPAVTAQAFQAVANLILKAVAPLAKALIEPQEAIQRVADALHAIGRAAYATRAALQDTVDDILRLLNKIGGLQGLGGGGFSGRASGGPVRKGSAYVVGEAGPELFIPSVSGRIIPNSEQASMTALGAGGITNVFNFPNYVGSRNELVSEIRQGLLKIDLYNPGSAIARS